METPSNNSDSVVGANGDSSGEANTNVFRSECKDVNLMANASMLQLVPNLNGKNVIEYFRVLESTAKLNGWSQDQLVLITCDIKSEGQARKFIDDSVKSPNCSYAYIKELLLDRFRETPSVSDSFQNFSAANQFQFETVREFAARLEGLAYKSFNGTDKENNENISKNFAQKLILSQFISGLKQKIKSSVKIQDPQSFKDAVSLAIRVEDSIEDASPNVNVIDSQARLTLPDLHNVLIKSQEHFEKSINVMTQQMLSLNSRLDSLQQSQSRHTDKSVTPNICAFCLKNGHSVQNCFARKRELQNQQPVRESNYRGNNFGRQNFHNSRRGANTRQFHGRGNRHNNFSIANNENVNVEETAVSQNTNNSHLN